MHRWIAILFLTLGLTFTGRNLYVFTNYAINFDYISKVLCINKEQPKSKCNGKCHIAKQLKTPQPATANATTLPASQLGFMFYFFNSVEQLSVFDGDTFNNGYPTVCNTVIEKSYSIPKPPPLFC